MFSKFDQATIKFWQQICQNVVVRFERNEMHDNTKTLSEGAGYA